MLNFRSNFGESTVFVPFDVVPEIDEESLALVIGPYRCVLIPNHHFVIRKLAN